MSSVVIIRFVFQLWVIWVKRILAADVEHVVDLPIYVSDSTGWMVEAL